MFQACKSAAMKDSLARCPKMARTEDGYCQIHATPERRWDLPEPKLILIRFQLTKELADIAIGLGIHLAERSAERQNKLTESRSREARCRWGRQTGTTGTLLFGPEGLRRVKFPNLVTELGARDFRLTDAHIVYWALTDCDHLCLSFTKSKTNQTKESVAGISFHNEHLAGSVFDVRGYHNPPDLSGEHDTNYSLDCRFAVGEALCELSYNGDWVAKEIIATRG